MKPTLLLLAAGMGSRYGGLKQLDGVGPNGETIMDYSIYDAIQAGFGKAVFVIRKDFEQEFRDKILSKYESKIETELVFQSLDALPKGFQCPKERVKPWGTNHAIMMGENVIQEPFCVINCDDFYNRDSFKVIGEYLANLDVTKQGQYAMVGFRVCNTLSENGIVARGVCQKDENSHLTTIVERTQIERHEGKVCYNDGNDNWIEIDENCPVSMNMWGFTPDYFKFSKDYFCEFLSNPDNLNNIKSEFYIPSMVDHLINTGDAVVKVLDTEAKWFGVTYAEDRDGVVVRLKNLIASGVYPEKLF